MSKVTTTYEDVEISWTADDSYVVSEAGLYLGRTINREFYKTNNIPAIAVFRNGVGGPGWSGPVLVSTDPTAVRFSVEGETLGGTAYSINDVTWYVNGNYHYQSTDFDSTGLHEISGQGMTSEIVESILREANVHVIKPVENEITVKWQRPIDERELTTTFIITVTESSNSENIDQTHTGEQED